MIHPRPVTAREAFLSEAAQVSDAAAWRRYIAATAKQPQCDPTLTLVGSDYEHNGLWFDLYSETDKDNGDIEVTEVILAGTTINMTEMFSRDQLKDAGYWCERKADREYRAGTIDRAIDRAHDRMEVNKAFNG